MSWVSVVAWIGGVAIVLRVTIWLLIVVSVVFEFDREPNWVQ